MVDDQAEADKLHYTKTIEPILSSWSFDVIIESTASGRAFKGTITISGTEYEFRGKFWMTVNQNIEVGQEPAIPKPEKLEGLIGDLIDITPFAYKQEGTVQQYQDGAQVLGDEIWQKVSDRILPNGDRLTKSTSDLLACNL